MRDNTIDDKHAAHSNQRQRLRQAGRRTGAGLPPINADTYRRIAELLRAPINQYVGDQRPKDGAA